MAEKRELLPEYESLIQSMVEIRNQNGLSQKKLVEQCGMTQNVVGRIENHTSVPSVETLLRILQPMGVTLAVVPIKK